MSEFQPTWTLIMECPLCRQESVWDADLEVNSLERDDRVRRLRMGQVKSLCPCCNHWCLLADAGWLWVEEPRPPELAADLAA